MTMTIKVVIAAIEGLYANASGRHYCAKWQFQFNAVSAVFMVVIIGELRVCLYGETQNCEDSEEMSRCHFKLQMKSATYTMHTMCAVSVAWGIRGAV